MNVLTQKSGGNLKIQPKLHINQPGDKYEQEADAMANRVVRMPANSSDFTPKTGLIGASVQRKCAACEEEEKHRSIMRKETSGFGGMAVTDTFSSSLNSNKGGGSLLPQGTRSFMENAFSTDFSNVRIHNNSQANNLSQSINAKAFTHGNDIYFGAGQYNPNSYEGKSLLAHELTHTVQQGGRSKLKRACINNPTECANQCGQPGDFVSQSEATVVGTRASVASQITADPVSVASTGQSRRATNLETIARNNGLYPRPYVYGIFVDLTIPSSYAAVTSLCNRFNLWPSPYTGTSDSRCTFFPNSRETDAATYLTNPSIDTLSGMSRADWLRDTLQFITHEFQHVAFNTGAHLNKPGAICTRNTTIFADAAGTTYSLDYLLSELSSEISEFLSLFNQIDRSRPPIWHLHEIDPVALAQQDHRRYIEMMAQAKSMYNWKVENCGEGIRGILRAIRCHCDCAESDFYIQDTINFTTNLWPPHIKAFFRDMLQNNFSGLGWP